MAKEIRKEDIEEVAEALKQLDQSEEARYVLSLRRKLNPEIKKEKIAGGPDITSFGCIIWHPGLYLTEEGLYEEIEDSNPPKKYVGYVTAHEVPNVGHVNRIEFKPMKQYCWRKVENYEDTAKRFMEWFPELDKRYVLEKLEKLKNEFRKIKKAKSLLEKLVQQWIIKKLPDKMIAKFEYSTIDTFLYLTKEGLIEHVKGVYIAWGDYEKVDKRRKITNNEFEKYILEYCLDHANKLKSLKTLWKKCNSNER
jgi:hypothetical protein